MRHFILAAAIAALGLTASTHAAVVFDDFNVSEGHFNLAPTFSGTSNVATSSTADRTTTNPFEGDGAEHLVLNLNTANPARDRFLSGSGTVANNVAFNTTSGTDGWIGFYYKTSSPGLKLAINLDGSDGAAASMDMSALTTVNADGAWHLAEWNLDATSGWGAVSGIGGGHSGALLDGSHTIDSIYVQNITADSVIDLDFVALNPTGSVANLVPEPASLSLLALGALPLLRRRRHA